MSCYLYLQLKLQIHSRKALKQQGLAAFLFYMGQIF